MSLKLSVLISSILVLEISTFPCCTFQKRIINFSKVDFPLPLLPTMPTILFLGTAMLISDRTTSLSYAKVTFSTCTPVNDTAGFPVISSVKGVSSKISNTRLPAANVFCNVLPKFAKATTGPNELIIAMTEINNPSKPIMLFTYNKDAAVNINKLKIKIMVLVIAIFRPIYFFCFSSSLVRLSVRLSNSFKRFLPV